MTTFGKKGFAGLALALASVTALAACSSSGSGSASPTSSASPGMTTEPGSIGGIPAPGAASGKAGSVTYGYLAADAPNWILPIIPAADNSVYNSFVFSWQMWRPTWFTWNGSSPAVNAALSPVNTPTWSNGDKTATITVKPWKWSDGQTLSAKDFEFTIDEIVASLKESPANWANYVPGYFPDTLTSMSTPNAQHAGDQHVQAGQPDLAAGRHHRCRADACPRVGQGFRERADAGLTRTRRTRRRSGTSSTPRPSR